MYMYLCNDDIFCSQLPTTYSEVYTHQGSQALATPYVCPCHTAQDAEKHHLHSLDSIVCVYNKIEISTRNIFMFSGMFYY